MEIVIGIIIGVITLIVLFLIGILIKRNIEIGKMKHLETQEIIKDIYAIKTKNANFYIIGSNDEYIAIDAGNGDEKTVKNELSKLNIDPEKIKTALLTHTDYDHIFALRLFKNAAVYISKEEVQMIDGSSLRMFILKNKLNYNYKILENNQELNFGQTKVKCILTPGHTKGSMSFLINDKYLFTGDTISLQDGAAKLFNSFFNMDDNTQIESIKNLAKLENIKYIFTAHYGFSNDYNKTFKNYNYF